MAREGRRFSESRGDLDARAKFDAGRNGKWVSARPGLPMHARIGPRNAARLRYRPGL